ncbi:hypothetical protein G7079_09210 [Thermomonas sp. HDW16]|nr:hypothetical protein G7079_09210 [Thermomonas sp. HDW16]
MQIQGSGKIQLKDGGLIRLAYAEQNGYPFMPNATRGDSDALLLAIKARALMEPESIEIPGGTRGVKKPGGGQDDEVARIVAALQGNGSYGSPATGSKPKAATSKKKVAKAKPRPKPAASQSDDFAPAETIAVESSDVEAMIQALLSVPVADESDYVTVEDDVPAQVADTPRPSAKSKPSAKPAPRMDMSEFEGKGGGKGAGQAVGSGKAVPKTGIGDPSYVFFRRIGDGPEGPIGALGVPLSPGRSMAVDPRATPLGAPVFIDGQQPGGKGPMRRLVFAQDTGGAIRGSVRGDFFWGFGDKAGKMALQTNQPVKMWLLLPKAVAGSAAASGIKTRGAAPLRDCAVPDEEFCVEDDGSTLDELLPAQ